MHRRQQHANDPTKVTGARSTRRRFGTWRIARFFSNYGLLVSIALWLIWPLTNSIIHGAPGNSGPSFGVFVTSLWEPLAFVPGMLGILIVVTVMSYDSHKRLLNRMDGVAEQVRELHPVVRSARSAYEATKLELVYQRLRSKDGDPKKAGIADFAKDIFERALAALEQLDEEESYKLDVRERTERYTEEWIR